MHEHETSESSGPRRRPRPETSRAATSAPGLDLLGLQRLAGNRAVVRRVEQGGAVPGSMARSVMIDEMDPTVPEPQEEQPGWQPSGPGRLGGLVDDEGEAGDAGGEPGATPSTLPAGGRAPIEQEQG
jgi:hypothetical protein